MPGKIRYASLGILLAALPLVGCAPTYSPDIYASNAAQQANKVDQGVVVGVRAVEISADASVGTATGAAAGGIVGSQVGGGGPVTALGALGGSVAGGVAGSMVSHAAGDTDGFEYIVKKPNGDLLSVTQKDAEPLGVGAHVLIIEGPQARIVPDYTVPIVVQPLHPEPGKPAGVDANAQDAHPSAADLGAKAPESPATAITSSPLPPPAAPGEADKPPDTPVAPPGSI
jgi:outer membrane lipoprotein SlyB